MQDRFARGVAVRFVRQCHIPDGTAMSLERHVHPGRLDRECPPGAARTRPSVQVIASTEGLFLHFIQIGMKAISISMKSPALSTISVNVSPG